MYFKGVYNNPLQSTWTLNCWQSFSFLSVLCTVAVVLFYRTWEGWGSRWAVLLCAWLKCWSSGLLVSTLLRFSQHQSSLRNNQPCRGSATQSCILVGGRVDPARALRSCSAHDSTIIYTPAACLTELAELFNWVLLANSEEIKKSMVFPLWSIRLKQDHTARGQQLSKKNSSHLCMNTVVYTFFKIRNSRQKSNVHV